MLGGANSGQTSIKCCDLACNIEPPPLKNCRNLTVQLKVEYLFPTSSSGSNFYVYQLPEGLGIRKILAHSIRTQKNPQTRADIFFIFTFSWSYVGPKSNLYPTRKFHQWRRSNPEIIYFCKTFIPTPYPPTPSNICHGPKVIMLSLEKYLCWWVVTFSNRYFYLFLFGEYVVLP